MAAPQSSLTVTYDIKYDNTNEKITVMATYPGGINNLSSTNTIKVLSDAFFIAWLVSPSIGFPKWQNTSLNPKIPGVNSITNAKSPIWKKVVLLLESIGILKSELNSFWPQDDVSIEVKFSSTSGNQPKGWKYPADLKRIIPNPDDLIAKGFVAVITDDPDQFVSWLKSINEQNIRVAKVRAASYGYEIEFSGFETLASTS